MTREDVVELMASSKSKDEWSLNSVKVKDAFGGDYPDFWTREIFLFWRI